jgi:hypothetical protein
MYPETLEKLCGPHDSLYDPIVIAKHPSIPLRDPFGIPVNPPDKSDDLVVNTRYPILDRQSPDAVSRESRLPYWEFQQNSRVSKTPPCHPNY